MTIFGIGPAELLIIVIIALVVVGPERLPEMLFQIGQGINKVKRMVTDLRDQAKSELGDDYESIESMTRQLRELDPRRQIQDLGRSLLDEPIAPSTLDLNIDKTRIRKEIPADKRNQLAQLAQQNLNDSVLDQPLDELNSADPLPVSPSSHNGLLDQSLPSSAEEQPKETL